jgi:hypothetical protein
MTNWYYSCPKFTVLVKTDATGTIVWAAPIVRRFIGQPLSNLERWQGGKAIQL